ncbi:MAG: cytochrome c [Bacteroidales bacterium]
MKSKVVLFSLSLFMGSFMLLSIQTVSAQKAKEWATPANFKNMKNPVKADQASIDAGKALWNKHCKSCHGSKGLGDGTKAAALKTSAGDFSTKEFQASSDGVLFYRTTEGRDEMPSYKKSIAADNDRWHLVNFMRTLKK